MTCSAWAGTGKGICSFGVGEASADVSTADMLDQVRHSPLFLEKRLGEVDDVLCWCAAAIP